MSASPPTRRARTVTVLAPPTIEEIPKRLIAAGDHESATLVSVLAYGGLRPQEALALQWHHVGQTTLLIEQELVDGRVLLGQ